MKVLLYAKNQQVVSKSGVGKAMSMQKEALLANGVEVTENSEDSYDVVHINTIFPSDYRMAKRAKRKGKSSVPRTFHKGRFSKFIYRFKFNSAAV